MTFFFSITLLGSSVVLASENEENLHRDIIEVADRAGSFDILLTAIQEAGLTETLRGNGPFTVFAPTDEAFKKIPSAQLQELLKPENKDQLVAILTYHVVPGEITSSDLLNVSAAQTVNGTSLPIGLSINQANVIQADVKASNGVIHVIDSVIMPELMLSSTAAAVNLITAAIDRGAPLYNKGQAEACAAIYEMTAKALLELDTELPNRAELALKRALRKIQYNHNQQERAWIMRDGLDEALASMTQRRMMTSSLGKH